MTSIKVLLAEDHTIVRKGIRSLLDAEPDIDVVGEAENGREAVEQTANIKPDIVVMDHSMPVLNGLEAMRQIHHQQPDVKVLILTMHTNEEYVYQFLSAWAAGFLVKQSAPNELVAAIHAVAEGKSYLSPTISKSVIDGYVRRKGETTITDSYDTLTAREREIFQLIAEGYTNREIGEQLHISLKTAAVHRTNIMQKLHLNTMSDLTRYAIRRGIISL